MDISLESSVTLWVQVPIVIIVFFSGLLLRYLGVYQETDVLKEKVGDIARDEVFSRAQRFIENCSSLDEHGFTHRKLYFVGMDGQGGSLRDFIEDSQPKSLLDGGFRTPQLNSTMIANGLNLVLMNIISSLYSGLFVAILYFTPPIGFRPLLQRGVYVSSVDLSRRYISTSGWFLIVNYGCQGIFSAFSMVSGTSAKQTSKTGLPSPINQNITLKMIKAIEALEFDHIH